MKTFVFQFEALLKVRRHQRDICRQRLADALIRDSDLMARRGRTEAERHFQFEELRALEGGGKNIEVGSSASRRLYAGQLSSDIGRIDSERAGVARELDLCRAALVRADQSVKSLEKLAERQSAEFARNRERSEVRDQDQTWQAIKASASICPGLGQ